MARPIGYTGCNKCSWSSQPDRNFCNIKEYISQDKIEEINMGYHFLSADYPQ